MGNSYKTVDEVPVFVKSHNLVLLVYKITKNFPRSEIFGLVSQLRRSASSIPANITEGFYRKSTRELIHFLYNARGSVGETMYHLRLAWDLGYIEDKDYQNLEQSYADVVKQLNGWIKSLRSKIVKND